MRKKKGYSVEVKPSMGRTQSITVGPDGFYGASDPRKPYALTAEY